jgi:nitric oxide dioxygenase
MPSTTTLARRSPSENRERRNRVQPHRCFQLVPVVAGGAQRSAGNCTGCRRTCRSDNRALLSPHVQRSSELLRVFNQGNQATGEQSKALAGSVVAYAVQLIDPEAPSFDHVMRRIAYKHVSLGIRRSSTRSSGEHLLASVGEVLGDAVTPEIAAAWSEVYWLFALQLVAEESRMYQQADVDPDQPTRPYRVVRRIDETADVISLVLEPADGGPLPAIAPGQLVSVFVDLPNGDRQPRQYTVSSTAVRTRLQITVLRVRGVERSARRPSFQLSA